MSSSPQQMRLYAASAPAVRQVEGYWLLVAGIVLFATHLGRMQSSDTWLGLISPVRRHGRRRLHGGPAWGLSDVAAAAVLATIDPPTRAEGLAATALGARRAYERVAAPDSLSYGR